MLQQQKSTYFLVGRSLLFSFYIRFYMSRVTAELEGIFMLFNKNVEPAADYFYVTLQSLKLPLFSGGLCFTLYL